MTEINATKLNPEELRKVKVLINQYLMYREGVEESTKELTELNKRQEKTYVNLSPEIDLTECHRSIEITQMKKAKINLSVYGIIIDES